MSLFPAGGAGGAGGAPAASNGALVEFRAGKMNYDGRMVTPDKRKGRVRLTLQDDLLHFQWMDRSNGNVEEDLILFPEDATFFRVTKCTTGRVYLLDFKSSSRKLFFWMQEPKEDKDEEYCQKINQLINDPSSAAATVAGGAAGSAANPLASLGGGDMDQESLMRMFQQVQGGLPPGATPDISALLNSLGAPQTAPAPALGAPAETAPPASGGAGAGAGAAAAGGAAGSASNLRLQDIVRPDEVVPLLSRSDFQQRLLQHLPAGTRNNPNEVAETLRSPQFQQALETFNAALQTGQLSQYMPQFGLSADSGTGDLETFLRAIQRAADETRADRRSSGSRRSSKGK